MSNIQQWSVDAWNDTPNLLILPPTSQVIPGPFERWFDTEAEALAYIIQRKQKEDQAKGRYMAQQAGPELLAMLEAIYDAEFGYGTWPSECDIKAVIAKAKG